MNCSVFIFALEKFNAKFTDISNVVTCNLEKPNILKKHITFIFRIKEWTKQETSRCRQQTEPLAACICWFFCLAYSFSDRLCGLVVRVLGYRSGGPGSIPGTTRKKVMGLERGALSLVSTTEELLDRKVAAPV
jgi:hypothetical protein